MEAALFFLRKCNLRLGCFSEFYKIILNDWTALEIREYLEDRYHRARNGVGAVVYNANPTQMDMLNCYASLISTEGPLDRCYKCQSIQYTNKYWDFKVLWEESLKHWLTLPNAAEDLTAATVGQSEHAIINRLKYLAPTAGTPWISITQLRHRASRLLRSHNDKIRSQKRRRERMKERKVGDRRVGQMDLQTMRHLTREQVAYEQPEWQIRDEPELDLRVQMRTEQHEQHDWVLQSQIKMEPEWWMEEETLLDEQQGDQLVKMGEDVYFEEEYEVEQNMNIEQHPPNEKPLSTSLPSAEEQPLLHKSLPAALPSDFDDRLPRDRAQRERKEQRRQHRKEKNSKEEERKAKLEDTRLRLLQVQAKKRALIQRKAALQQELNSITIKLLQKDILRLRNKSQIGFGPHWIKAFEDFVELFGKFVEELKDQWPPCTDTLEAIGELAQDIQRLDSEFKKAIEDPAKWIIIAPKQDPQHYHRERPLTLTSLPNNILMQIFSHLLPISHPIDINVTRKQANDPEATSTSTIISLPTPPIARTCYSLRALALSEYFESNNFVVHIPSLCSSHVAKLERAVRRMVRHTEYSTIYWGYLNEDVRVVIGSSSSFVAPGWMDATVLD